MTDHIDEHQRTNGSVLVVASVAAGAIGGTVALLNEARKHAAHQPAPAEVVQDEVKQSAKQLRESTSRVLEVSKEQAPVLSQAIKEQASTQIGRISDHAAPAREHLRETLESHGVDVSAGVDLSRDAVKHAGDIAADVGAQAKKKAKKAKKDMSKGKVKVDVDAFSQAGRDLSDRLHEQLPEAGKNVSDQVAPRLADFKEQAGSTLAGVIEAGRAHAPELAPKLKDLGKHASDVAASAAESGREHAPEWKALFEEHLVPKLQDVRERAATLASDAQTKDGMVPDLKHSADDLAKRFADSLGSAERSISDLKGNASHAVESVGTQARVVGKNASDGGKNAGAAIVWTGVAAGVVYAGLLKPEQREWVKQKANAAYRSAKNAYSDMRGRDGDFNSETEKAS